MGSPVKRYMLSDAEAATVPNYGGVARSLSDAELEDEILGKRGLPEYQTALLVEAERRAQTPPVQS